jgi:hypothetical protein
MKPKQFFFFHLTTYIMVEWKVCKKIWFKHDSFTLKNHFLNKHIQPTLIGKMNKNTTHITPSTLIKTVAAIIPSFQKLKKKKCHVATSRLSINISTEKNVRSQVKSPWRKFYVKLVKWWEFFCKIFKITQHLLRGYPTEFVFSDQNITSEKKMTLGWKDNLLGSW